MTLIDPGLIQDHNSHQLRHTANDYEHLGEQLARRNIDIEVVRKKVAAFGVAIPSWGVGTGGTSRERFAQLHCHRLLRFAATDSRRCATTDSRRCAALPQRSLTPNAHSGTSPAHAEFDVSFACLLFFAGAYYIRPAWTPLWRRSRTFFLEAGLLTEGRPARAVTRTTPGNFNSAPATAAQVTRKTVAACDRLAWIMIWHSIVVHELRILPSSAASEHDTRLRPFPSKSSQSLPPELLRLFCDRWSRPPARRHPA